MAAFEHVGLWQRSLGADPPEDLRSQYVLAYTPSNGVKDGSFRTIQLRVRNQKDLNVRHRRGYFAPGAKAS